LKLFERFLTSFKNDVCNILDKQLAEANKLLKEKVLDPSNEKIQETLDHLKGIREDIKKGLDELHKEISKILNNGKELTEDLTSPSLADLIKEIYSKVEAFNVRSYIGYFAKNKESSNGSQRDNEFFAMIKKYKDKAEKLQNEVKELKKQMEELKNKQTQPSEPETSSTTSNGPQRDEEEILDEELARLEKEEKMEEKREKIKNLKEARPKQKEIKEWKKEINGKPREFLYYVLESIKLGEKATLRNLNNKIIIHWKDGSQTICHIKKQGNLQIEPSAAMFTDPSIQAAWEMVRE
jgi:DNA-binding ferritin-like protein